MKEKLLKLIDACINDISMYTLTYHKNELNPGTNCVHGISERIDNLRTAYVSEVKYEGQNAYGDKDFQFDIKHLDTYMNAYNISIGFGKEPQLLLRSLLNKSKPMEKVIHQVSGTRKTFFNKNKPVIFDVITFLEPHHYELKCGSFTYIVEDSVVKNFYDRIKQKRKEIATEAELKEINSRLEKYQIS